jgi:hypothetical protein
MLQGKQTKALGYIEICKLRIKQSSIFSFIVIYKTPSQA